MAQRSFKTDESFLEKLAIGAIGTRKVINDLSSKGHLPIELERGSSDYKIWKSIKIKRIRVPDILCLNSGVRIESRAKTNLAISMSHSFADETRGWDYGLKDEDYIALAVCTRCGEEPVDWMADDLVQYLSVLDLRKAFHSLKVIKETMKGAGEGFESRLTWPSAIASSDGVVSEISPERLKYKRSADGRTISLSLKRRNIPLVPMVDVGVPVRSNQIIASVVPIQFNVPATTINQVDFYQSLLNSTSISDRYSATKASSYIPAFNHDLLLNRINDPAEHIYVKLEASASLARKNIDMGYEFIEQSLSDDYLEHRLEATIILGEIHSSESCRMLCRVLEDKGQHEEIRSGAAWALGELQFDSSIPCLVNIFSEMSRPIRQEAARALLKLCNSHPASLIHQLSTTDEIKRPGIAWALSRSTNWDYNSLHSIIDVDNFDLRQWIAYILGNPKQNRLIEEIEQLNNSDPQIYFAVTVLWKIASSWINNLKEY